MLNKLKPYLSRPELYTTSANLLWDDEYISEILLDTHLEPNYDSATRNHKFVAKSVEWIAKLAPPSKYAKLLDLGCGPGIYAEHFHKAGYAITGIDFSRRSIRYAEVQAVLEKTNIKYHCKNYMDIDYVEQFDVITLIYCDYAVLSASGRRTLLDKIYKALKPGGMFIFDVFTHKMRAEESRKWYYSEHSGLYADEPHICLMSVYQYDDADKTELRQTVVITEDAVKCYNIWDHFFNKDEIINEVLSSNFKTYKLYDDVAGKEYSGEYDTICCVLTK